MMLHFVQRIKQSYCRPVRRLQRESRKRHLTLECLEDRRLLTAQPLTEAGLPSIHEQYLLELINRGRSNPVTEAARYSIGLNDGLSPGTISTQAKPPLAFSTELIAAAQGHSEWMLANNTFSHTGEGGSSPGSRMTAAGYVFVSPWSWGENISWRGTVGPIDETAYVEMIAEGLFKSPGHRVNQLKPEFRETGVGAVQGDYTSSGLTWNALMVTEKFARSGNTVFMTGVIYDDTLVRNDQFYTPGEGLGAVTIEATRTSDSRVFSTQTWSSGGYSLALPSGTYTVVAKGGSLTAPVVRGGVVIGTENVKVDFTPSDVSDLVPPPPDPDPEPELPPPPDPVTVVLGANPQTVTQSGLVTLTATVTGGTAVRVQFYRDSNGNGVWDSGDLLLGTDQEGSNGWSVVVSSAAWPVGQQRLFARAQDQVGVWCNVAATNVSVNAEVKTPVVGGSGNVTVTVKSGDLLITGDNLANSVQVRRGSATGQWVVTGLGNTTINKLSQPATLAGVTRDVIIRLQSGDDILNVEGISVPRNLRVEMGAGNTQSVFESIAVGGNAAFYHGSGQRNQLTVTASQVKGKVDLRGGSGSDQVTFSRTSVGNDLIANLAGGADLLEVRSATVGRNLSVQTGSRAGQEAKVWIGYGKDQVDEDVLTSIAQDLVVRGGAGVDRFDIQGVAARRDLTVDTGAGDDLLDLLASSSGRNTQIKLTNGTNLAWVDEVTVGSRFGLDGGRGQDRVLIGSRAELGVRSGTSVINLGSGNDTLLLCESTFAQLQVNTTSGNNDVYLECNTVTARTTLRGGSGIDRLTKDLNLNDQLANLSVTKFLYELPKWPGLSS
ncbi:MAG: CAP domain-containing protein [Pirellulaceae bacterium]|nr:CAP domain-containing protein [Pirellulaceae bacterium]